MMAIVRETKETKVSVQLGLRGATSAAVETKVATRQPFLDHMLKTFAFYAGLDLVLEASGDLPHHLVEDVALALGEAVARLVPERAARYGERTLPMDDALVQAAIDVGGRPYYAGRLPSSLYDHWFRSFATQARATLHVRVLRGRDRHHVIEAAFKALGLALAQALAESGPLFSTKGAVRWGGGGC